VHFPADCGKCARVETPQIFRLKAGIGRVQVTSSFWSTFIAPWPESLSLVFQYSAVANINIFAIKPISCLAMGWTSRDKLLFYTLAPALVMLLLAIPVFFARVFFAGHRKLESKEFIRLESNFYNWVSDFVHCSSPLVFTLHFWMANAPCQPPRPSSLREPPVLF
jgi:uncharacterized membrane protein YfbV (UPF0208 family)